MTRRIAFLSLLTATLLVASVAATVGIAAAFDPGGVGGGGPSRAQQEANWEYANYNKWVWNSNPQTDINPSNAQHLEMRWIFPIPGADSVKADLQPGIAQGGGQGSIVPPIVVDGKVYLMTEWKRLYAIDVDTGVSAWSWTQEVDYTAAVDNCDPACFPPTAGSHIHAINYDTHTGLIWTAGYICQVFGIEAERGDVVYQLVDLCKDVPGNDGAFYANQGVFPPTIYTAENYLVHSWSTQDRNWGGRGYMYGVDLDSVQRYVPHSVNFDTEGWRFFTTPPRTGDPEFTLRHCDNIWFAHHRAWREGRSPLNQIACNDVKAQCYDCLYNDWHMSQERIDKSSRGTPIHITTSTTAMWGQFPLDESTGIVYGCTGNKSAWHNISLAGDTGPNWPATALLAVKADTGEHVWSHQTVPRDNWDWDCNWSTKLGFINFEGKETKVALRHSKPGSVWALDALTGEAVWHFFPTNLRVPTFMCPSDPNPDYGVCVTPREGGECHCYYMLDVTSKSDMSQIWGENGETIDFLQAPSVGGASESEFAFNHDTKMIYYVAQNLYFWISVTPTLDEPHGGSSSLSIPADIQRNTTIWAVDANTGEAVWTFYIPDQGFRGGVMESGGIVYVPSPDGNLYMVDANSGELITKRNFGHPLLQQTTIGKTEEGGESVIFQLYGGTFWVGFAGFLGDSTRQHVPGALVAYSLPDVLPEAEVVVREVQVPGPERTVEVEVVKEVEVTKEVEVEVIKEVEVVKEVPVETTVEVINPLSYIAIAVGVVLVVVAGVLFQRSKTAT